MIALKAPDRSKSPRMHALSARGAFQLLPGNHSAGDLENAAEALETARARISYSQVKSNNGGHVRILRRRAPVDRLSGLLPREHADREGNLKHPPPSSPFDAPTSRTHQLSLPFSGTDAAAPAAVGSRSQRALRRAAAARQVRFTPTLEETTDRMAA
ncbi:MAG TPA: hypothetical protein VKO16_03215, partial [Polyangia bacterium]|nr:hypothetical protein [Polyangia bacterium]